MIREVEHAFTCDTIPIAKVVNVSHHPVSALSVPVSSCPTAGDHRALATAGSSAPSGLGFYVSGIMQCALLGPAFTQHNYFEKHQCCTYQFYILGFQN